MTRTDGSRQRARAVSGETAAAAPHRATNADEPTSTAKHPYHDLMVLCALLLHTPLLVLVDVTDKFAVFCALAVFVNTYVRTAFPSCYVPATQAAPGLLHNPLFARCLATVAEITFYDAQARGFNLEPWAHSTAVAMCIFGECICWSHLIFQSELIALVEDSCWWTIQTFFLITSPSQLRWPVCLPFCVYLLTYHLPRMSKRVTKPYVSLYPGARIAARDADTVAWTIPTLYVMSGGYCLFLYMHQVRQAGGELVLW